MISLGGYLQIKFGNIKTKALSQGEIDIFELNEYNISDLLTKYLYLDISKEKLLEVVQYFDSKKKRDYSRRVRRFLTKNGVVSDKADDKYIYLVANEDGLVKIGRSKDPIKRVRELSTGSDSHLICVAYWKVKEKSNIIEKEIHKYFEEYRVKGEWFSFHNFSIEDIELAISCEFERVYYNKFIHKIEEKQKNQYPYIRVEKETQKAFLFRDRKGAWWCPKSVIHSVDREKGIVLLNYNFKPQYSSGRKKFW